LCPGITNKLNRRGARKRKTVERAFPGKKGKWPRKKEVTHNHEEDTCDHVSASICNRYSLRNIKKTAY